jgi:hypothetical protein
LFLEVEKFPHVNTRREGFVCEQERNKSTWDEKELRFEEELSKLGPIEKEEDDDGDDESPPPPPPPPLAPLLGADITALLLLLLRVLFLLLLKLGSSGSICAK